jgi:hypothetical protein
MVRRFGLLIIAGMAAMVLTFVALAMPRAVRAQTDSIEASSPDTAAVSNGCWQGMVFNDAQGIGTITFIFEISKSHKIVKSGSMYVINYDEGLTEMSPISGKVTATQFKWKGKAIGNQGSKCAISGLGSAQNGVNFLDGNYRYTGKCTEISGPHNPFTGGSFSKLEFLGPTCP